MNLVYLSPHYPTHFSLFPQRLAHHGINVIGITDQNDEQLSPDLRRSLIAHYKVSSLHNTDEVLGACRHIREHIGPIDRVESHLEPWVETEAAVRQEFDVFGVKPDDLKFMKQKSMMKKLFDKAQVPVVRGAIVETIDQCKAFIGDGYPAFIKPDIGVGASDTYTIRDLQGLEEFFQVKGTHPYFIEEFIDGAIESFDGFADHHGELVFWTSHVFSNDIHKIVANNENLFYYNVREIPEDVETYGRAIVKAADIREKFFHIEFFRLADGSLRALEINMRPPGGLSTHMINYSSDIDVYDWWARIMAGETEHPPFERKYHCSHVARKFDREYRYSHEDIYRTFPEEVVHSQAMNPIEFIVMGNWAYLVRSPSEQRLREIIDYIIAEAS